MSRRGRFESLEEREERRRLVGPLIVVCSVSTSGRTTADASILGGLSEACFFNESRMLT